ncbi:MAG: HYR domain-containing protein, partial [Gammaproteobacteria bacterium]|nr:HYR domain-containing protein [Gammaproteobacteria bacterium]
MADTRLIAGNSSKGPISGALVRAYEVDDRGNRTAVAIAETRTDASGNWSLNIPFAVGDLVIESSGGVYVDEADPEPNPALRRTIALKPADTFSALLPANAPTVAINAFTDALLRKARLETQGNNFFQVYELNRSFFNSAFGFDIVTVQPADPINPDSSSSIQSRQYAMALGAFANIINSVAIENAESIPSFGIISAVISDLSDCVIDGRSVAGAITDITIPEISLNSELIRFRNNNFSAYGDTPLLTIRQFECARSGQLADQTGPAFLFLPDDISLESTDGEAVDSNYEPLQDRLRLIHAVDDRDGPVAFSTSIPDSLNIGSTSIAFSASDQAGNTTLATVVVNLRSPEPPVITAPANIFERIPPAGYSQLSLGQPQVSDNVSSGSGLVVTNDAPVQGFSRGITIVTWTVTDEIGLSAQAEQRVRMGIVDIDPRLPIGPPGTQLPVFSDHVPIDELPGSGNSPARATADLLADNDGDGLSNIFELIRGWNPAATDSDHDGVSDGVELEIGSDPLMASVAIRVFASDKDTEQIYS